MAEKIVIQTNFIESDDRKKRSMIEIMGSSEATTVAKMLAAPETHDSL